MPLIINEIFLWFVILGKDNGDIGFTHHPAARWWRMKECGLVEVNAETRRATGEEWREVYKSVIWGTGHVRAEPDLCGAEINQPPTSPIPPTPILLSFYCLKFKPQKSPQSTQQSVRIGREGQTLSWALMVWLYTGPRTVIYSGITVAYNKPLFILEHCDLSWDRFQRDLMESPLTWKFLEPRPTHGEK